ncbi:hypothetical protein Val02_03210 [Virgisporangium aliadipatigenens]|uniref:GerMN domain-containing protein n=1 Tax=Virgisporangium aliadipatigenens TaxID=741659 RepID=A0A8J4DM55_9ACTN|nr:GerMN domain-containing protein [Virgisporangium aliadipatigenens]GIJ43435.1 hypothetical protein Val02_03210 [Virgisporangium aliadipatigenens]
MRRICCAVLMFLLAGCGVRPSGVHERGEAPTGVAPAVTLYFVDAQNRLAAQSRRTGRLGTIAEALSLLLEGPGGRDGLSTRIPPGQPTRVVVDTRPGLIVLRVPLAAYEVAPLGVDQIVCTALGVWIQSGGAPDARVRVSFTLPTPESDAWRTCPVLP